MQTNGRTFGKIILFLIVLLLSILLFSTRGYVPFSPPSTYARYEAFSSVDPSGSAVVVDPSGNKKTNDTIPSSILQSLFGTKSEGFSGMLPALQPSSQLSGAEIIDKFSQVSDKSTGNSGECISAGLSNSKGPLCLTPELVDLLKTRGNNM
jgi:hypothetical protein